MNELARKISEDNREEKVNIGVLFPSDLPEDTTLQEKATRKSEQTYAEIFGRADNKQRQELEKKFDCKFVAIDYHHPEVEKIISLNPDPQSAVKELALWLTKYCAQNEIHGLVGPGNDFNIITPGKNTDNSNRSLMEQAIFKVRRSIAIPSLDICGAEQSFCWNAVKRSVSRELKNKFQITSPHEKLGFMHAEFQMIFKEPFLDRYKNLLGYFKEEHARRGGKSENFNAESIALSIKSADTAEKKFYIGPYFEGYFKSCLAEIGACQGSDAQQAAFFKYFVAGDKDHFASYYEQTPPLKLSVADKASESCIQFNRLFDKYYAAYGEVNGIIIINNALLYTRENHNQDCNRISADIPVMLHSHGNWQSIYAKSFSGEKIGYTASEHNQAVIASPFVIERLNVAGVAVTATDNSGKIIKAAEKMSGVWHVATQTHPESVSLQKEKLQANPDQKLVKGVFAADYLMHDFINAAKQHLHKHPYIEPKIISWARRVENSKSQNAQNAK